MSRIFAVGSGKGGVGKTWLSITLAHALALRGRRVLLFDGDFGLANIDIQLGLLPSRTIDAALANQDRPSRRLRAAGGSIGIGRAGRPGAAGPGPAAARAARHGRLV